MNTVVTVPSSTKLKEEKELVLIPKREYETLLRMKSRAVPEIAISAATKRAIRKSEKELRAGQFITLSELHHVVGGGRTKARR